MNTQTQEVTGAVTTANALKMAIEAMEVADEALNEFFEGLVKLGVPKSILKMDKHTRLIPAINACKEALEQPAQERLTTLDEISADEMFRLNRDIVPLPEHLIHEIAQRNFHPTLGINPITFTLEIEQAHGIGVK